MARGHLVQALVMRHLQASGSNSIWSAWNDLAELVHMIVEHMVPLIQAGTIERVTFDQVQLHGSERAQRLMECICRGAIRAQYTHMQE